MYAAGNEIYQISSFFSHPCCKDNWAWPVSPWHTSSVVSAHHWSWRQFRETTTFGGDRGGVTGGIDTFCVNCDVFIYYWDGRDHICTCTLMKNILAFLRAESQGLTFISLLPLTRSSLRVCITGSSQHLLSDHFSDHCEHGQPIMMNSDKPISR